MALNDGKVNIAIFRGSVALHATECRLRFDKPQKNEIHSLRLLLNASYHDAKGVGCS